MACKDCEQGNPITPIYFGGKYIQNANCANPGCPVIYTPPDGAGGGGLPVSVIAGTDILVEDLSDANQYQFRVNYNPVVALTASLSITGYVGGILQSEPILKGKIVDEIRSSWSYNKAVASQELNDISVPVGDRNKTETGLNVTDDISYEIEGNDGLGQGGSIAADTDSLLFGNYMIWGDYPKIDGQATTVVNTLIANLANKTQQVKRDRNNSIYATGGTNQRFFVIYPAAWGEATFTKGIFEGGFQRLKNQAGTLVVEVTGTELPIEWTNEEGHTEEIYVYQSLYDDRADALEPIIVT